MSAEREYFHDRGVAPKKCSVCLELWILDLSPARSRRIACRLGRCSWFLSRVDLSMSFALDFPTVRTTDRATGRATTWSRPPAWGSRGRRAARCSGGRAGAERRREAVIRVAAKSKFKSNPYLHLSPCRRQIPPCFHIQVRCFNPETDAYC